MTTIERARRFFKRIDWWSGGNQYLPYRFNDEFQEWMMPRLWCQARVARALIRQKKDRALDDSMKNIKNDYKGGYLDGLYDALDILDAVYGREE